VCAVRFAIDKGFIERFDVRQVGSKIHLEYWIPADGLDEFNDNIVGRIDVVASFYGTGQ